MSSQNPQPQGSAAAAESEADDQTIGPDGLTNEERELAANKKLADEARKRRQQYRKELDRSAGLERQLKAAEKRIAELGAGNASPPRKEGSAGAPAPPPPAAPPPDVSRYVERAHRGAVSEAVADIDLAPNADRAKVREILLSMTKVDDDDRLVLLIDDGEIPADADTLRSLLPPELLRSAGSGGAGAFGGGRSEKDLPAVGRELNDEELIRRGSASSRFYAEHKSEILAAERRLRGDR